MKTPLARLAVVSGAGLAIACTGAIAAHATSAPTVQTTDATPATVSTADLAAATKAASTGRALGLATRAATAADPAVQGSLAPSARRTATLVPGTTTVVNMLSPRFVATGAGPVAELGYVANTAKVGSDTVTVWSVRPSKGAAWKAVNAASGDLEQTLAAKAGNAPMFREPQINAWYAIRDGRVVPLNADARTAIGDGMSVTDYQRRVHTAYASKLPGSAYDKSGMAGGFSQAASGTSSNDGMLAAGGGLGAVVAAFGATSLVRRRREGSA